MMELPAETPLLWAGLVVVAASLLAIAGSLPTRPAPNAADAAQTVDSIAASDEPASASRSLSAAEVRIRPHGLALRGSSGASGTISRAEFAFGPVTPVSPDSPLWQVLTGAPPAEVFDSQRAFRQAVVEARAAPAEWVPGDTLLVRGVSWDGYRVTLVGV